MHCIRIIPCLDIKDNRVVKGVNFLNLIDAGDPIKVAKKYVEGGADELCFLDITASVQKRKIVSELVSRIADEIFIPFTVGGGIRNIEDIESILHAGADKVSINTAAFENPDLIKNAAKIYGSQCIVCAIDVKKIKNDYIVFLNGGRTQTNTHVMDWAKNVVKLGAGEILLTSMDRDGTGTGYDLELLKILHEEIEVPIIASGGVGEIQHIIDAVKIGKADAILAASIFHFGKFTIDEVKIKMKQTGIEVRLQ